MTQQQFFTTIKARSISPQLRKLKENLAQLISHENTCAVHIDLSEAVWTSGRLAHAALYDGIAMQNDP